ncbi:hypothetical protein WN48_03307 [Eufriesea mexicana]|uniref:Uncharacterized protein n=1 Tax=Eufriesea mexicana TaxID=516756 RepID=A0A310SJM6_9HYME|nr:hypothetical protein WN48_03307 [Eufriesea mexicana]
MFCAPTCGTNDPSSCCSVRLCTGRTIANVSLRRANPKAGRLQPCRFYEPMLRPGKSQSRWFRVARFGQDDHRRFVSAHIHMGSIITEVSVQRVKDLSKSLLPQEDSIRAVRCATLTPGFESPCLRCRLQPLPSRGQPSDRRADCRKTAGPGLNRSPVVPVITGVPVVLFVANHFRSEAASPPRRRCTSARHRGVANPILRPTKVDRSTCGAESTNNRKLKIPIMNICIGIVHRPPRAAGKPTVIAPGVSRRNPGLNACTRHPGSQKWQHIVSQWEKSVHHGALARFRALALNSGSHASGQRPEIESRSNADRIRIEGRLKLHHSRCLRGAASTTQSQHEAGRSSYCQDSTRISKPPLVTSVPPHHGRRQRHSRLPVSSLTDSRTTNSDRQPGYRLSLNTSAPRDPTGTGPTAAKEEAANRDKLRRLPEERPMTDTGGQ